MCCYLGDLTQQDITKEKMHDLRNNKTPIVLSEILYDIIK